MGWSNKLSSPDSAALRATVKLKFDKVSFMSVIDEIDEL